MYHGRNVKKSDCCNAHLNTEGSVIHGYYDRCSICGKGSWPHGVDFHWEYIPSDYEKHLTDRIELLEQIIKIQFPEHWNNIQKKSNNESEV